MRNFLTVFIFLLPIHGECEQIGDGGNEEDIVHSDVDATEVDAVTEVEVVRHDLQFQRYNEQSDEQVACSQREDEHT